MANVKPYIAVIGAGTCAPCFADIAQEVGKLLALRGAVVVCGGLGGVMEAACRGAQSAGGMTVGILPSGNRHDANPFIGVAIATGLGEARNTLVVRSADAIIAIGGEFGTLSEIAFALKAGKPVVGFNTWELTKNGQVANGIVRAQDANDAVERVFGLL